jgi:uncharacterized protein
MFFLETLPLMLIGMALYRYGFFSGALNRGKMIMWGVDWPNCRWRAHLMDWSDRPSCQF